MNHSNSIPRQYLPTIHFKHCDIMDVFGGLFYLPLDQNSYLKVHSFVNKLECAFPSVQDTMLLYNSQLVWWVGGGWVDGFMRVGGYI